MSGCLLVFLSTQLLMNMLTLVRPQFEQVASRNLSPYDSQFSMFVISSSSYWIADITKVCNGKCALLLLDNVALTHPNPQSPFLLHMTATALRIC